MSTQYENNKSNICSALKWVMTTYVIEGATGY